MHWSHKIIIALSLNNATFISKHVAQTDTNYRNQLDIKKKKKKKKQNLTFVKNRPQVNKRNAHPILRS